MAAESMFNAVELRHASAGGSPSEKVAIRFSWYQIVHEELRDVLLSATSESQQQKLFMREDPAGNGIVVSRSSQPLSVTSVIPLVNLLC